MQALSSEQPSNGIDDVIHRQRGHHNSLPAVKASDLSWPPKLNGSRTSYKNNENSSVHEEDEDVDIDGDNDDQPQGDAERAEGKNMKDEIMSDDEGGGLTLVTGDEASQPPTDAEAGRDKQSRQGDGDNDESKLSFAEKADKAGDPKDDNTMQDDDDERLLAHCRQLSGQAHQQHHAASKHHHRKQQPPSQRPQATHKDQQMRSASSMMTGRETLLRADQFFDGNPRPRNSSASPNNLARRHSMSIQDLPTSAAIFPPRPGDVLLPQHPKQRIKDHDDHSTSFYDSANIRSSVIHSAGNNGSKLANNRLLSSSSAAINAATAAAAAAAALSRTAQPAPQQPAPAPATPSGNGTTAALVPMWKDREVIALLDLYASEKYQAKFRDPRNRKIFVWSEISTEINSQFFTGRTGMHCDQKFRNIKSAYKHRVLTNPNVSFVVRTNPIFQKMDAIYKMGLMDINDDSAGLSTAGAKRNRIEMPPPLLGQSQQLLLRHLQQQQQQQRHRGATSDDERDDILNEQEIIANYRRRASLDPSLLNDAVLQKRLRLQASSWASPWAAAPHLQDREPHLSDRHGDVNDHDNDHDEDQVGNKTDPTAPIDLSSAFTTVGNGASSRRASRLAEAQPYLLNGRDGARMTEGGDDGADDGDSRFSTTSSPATEANRSTASPFHSGRKLSLVSNQSSGSHHSFSQQATCSGCSQFGQVLLDFLIDMRDTAEVSHRQQSAKFTALIRRMESICSTMSSGPGGASNGTPSAPAAIKRN